MSVLLAREEEAKRAEEKAAAANSPLLYNHKTVNGDKISKVPMCFETSKYTKLVFIDGYGLGILKCT